MQSNDEITTPVCLEEFTIYVGLGPKTVLRFLAYYSGEQVIGIPDKLAMPFQEPRGVRPVDDAVIKTQIQRNNHRRR